MDGWMVRGDAWMVGRRMDEGGRMDRWLAGWIGRIGEVGRIR